MAHNPVQILGKDATTGLPEEISVVNHALSVNSKSGTGETSKNRLNNPDATYAESTNSVTWTASDNVTEIYITLFGDADTTTSDRAWAVFDAINATEAVALLGAAGGAAVDVQVVPLQYGVPNGPFIGTSYFTRLDVDLTDNAVMYVEAQ